MHPAAAVTNHHCIVYLGLGSPGVFFYHRVWEGIASVCQKEHTVWVGRRVDGWHFPFFFSFSIPSREIGSHDTLCYTLR